MNKHAILIIISIVIVVALVAGVLVGAFLNRPSSPTQKSITLNGAGATFPQPLLAAMISNYTTDVNPSVQINYDGVGSGTGITDLENKVNDFDASDAPLGASDMAKAPNVLHIPETIGGVTVAYNLPGIYSGLHLNGTVIADIFQCKVTMWNDSEIQSLNQNVTLPDQAIRVVHRADSSGTTYIFTGYLSKMSTSWNNSIGQGKTVTWPASTIGAQGNSGVAYVVQGQPYAIGYVELSYVLQNNMTRSCYSKSFRQLDFAKSQRIPGCCSIRLFKWLTNW